MKYTSTNFTELQEQIQKDIDQRFMKLDQLDPRTTEFGIELINLQKLMRFISMEEDNVEHLKFKTKD